MDDTRSPYSNYGLVQDMLQAADVVRRFDPAVVQPLVEPIRQAGKLLLTGEGSSRMFPGKSTLTHIRRQNWPLMLHVDGGRQAQDYRLDDWAVLAMSNSGRTAEVIRLYHMLKEQGHSRRYSLAAFPDSPLQGMSQRGFVLGCGKERAVAATKSVIEQALFCRSLVEAVAGPSTLAGRLPALADAMRQAAMLPVDAALIDKLANAGTIHLAGRNDGVAEELTLKVNEITRKRSDFLEGTYAVHGIEEAMQSDDVVIWIDPYPESESKFQHVLVDAIGVTVIAIASRPTHFPTVLIPDQGDLNGFVQMAAGWNLLVEIGLKLGIDIDKPQRARKVGNEFIQ